MIRDDMEPATRMIKWLTVMMTRCEEDDQYHTQREWRSSGLVQLTGTGDGFESYEFRCRHIDEKI